MCEATTAADVVFRRKQLRRGGENGKPPHRIRYKSSILIALIQRFPKPYIISICWEESHLECCGERRSLVNHFQEEH